MVGIAPSIRVAKLPIHRLKEAELSPIVHLHRIFAGTIDHVFAGPAIRAITVMTRVQRGQARAHTDHHTRGLGACAHRIILSQNCGVDVSFLLLLLISRVLSIDLA